MDKKPKMFGGKFNPEEVEAIERTLNALNINSKPNGQRGCFILDDGKTNNQSS